MLGRLLWAGPVAPLVRYELGEVLVTRSLACGVIVALSVTLAGTNPVHAQATQDDAARERVAAWNDRCGTLWAELQPWGTARLHSPDEAVAHGFIAVLAGRGGPVGMAEEYLGTCVPVISQILNSEVGGKCRKWMGELARGPGGGIEALLREPRQALAALEAFDDLRLAAEEYLGTCVPQYAAAIDSTRPSSSE